MSKNLIPFESTPPTNPAHYNLEAEYHGQTRENSLDCDLDSLPELDAIKDALVSVYSGVFEQLFGSLLANIFQGPRPTESLDHTRLPNSTRTHSEDRFRACPAISLFDLSCSLDQWMTQHTGVNTVSVSTAARRESSSADSCLLHAIYAFSARWLPLSYPSTGREQRSDAWYQDIAVQFWRQARVKLLRASNQVCYRSVVAMMLFWLTPAPYPVAKDEEMNGLSGTTCLQLSLQMLQMLRSQPRTWQFSSSGAPIRGKISPKEIHTDMHAEKKFLEAETYLYWAATAFDTANSVTLDVQSVLCAGLLGIKVEMTFELIRRSSLVFQEEMKRRPPTDTEFTDDVAMQVISATGLWKLYLYKRVAVFKEALRDGHHDSKVSWAFEETMDAIQHFNSVYRPLLDIYERRLQFLNRKSRFEWFHVILHWYLGILMLADATTSAGHPDFIESLFRPKVEAVQNTVNVLKFGLENTFTPITKDEATDVVERASTTPSVKLCQVACLVAWDPYSHHTMAAIKFVFEAISSDFANRRISPDAFEDVLCVLSSVLATMPSCSKYIQRIRHLVSETYHRLRPAPTVSDR